VEVPTVMIGPAVDASDQPEAPPKSFGPSVLVMFENVRYEDRKVLMARLRKHDGYLKIGVRMLEDKSGLVVSTIEQVSDWSFRYHIAPTILAACQSFNSKLVVCSAIAPVCRSAASVL
jgi:hypothetical protein